MSVGRTIADRMFDGDFAQNELDELLTDAGVNFERIGFDHYDCSLELYDVPPDERLSHKAQKIIYDAGFRRIYVNHTDKWETHYSPSFLDWFRTNPGWRVSYPHKRGDTEGNIWVEKEVPTWPRDWFSNGKVSIKP